MLRLIYLEMKFSIQFSILLNRQFLYPFFTALPLFCYRVPTSDNSGELGKYNLKFFNPTSHPRCRISVRLVQALTLSRSNAFLTVVKSFCLRITDSKSTFLSDIFLNKIQYDCWKNERALRRNRAMRSFRR